MKTPKTPCALLLELVERRIEQMDAFNRCDDRDLDVLMRCREKLKVAAHLGKTEDDGYYIATISSEICALGHSDLVQESLTPNLDVV